MVEHGFPQVPRKAGRRFCRENASEDSEKQAPEGYSDFGLESTTSEFNYEAYIDNEFFCLDKEGNWSEISRAKLAEFIPHFKNGADLGPLEEFKVSFTGACKAVYSYEE